MIQLTKQQKIDAYKSAISAITFDQEICVPTSGICALVIFHLKNKLIIDLRKLVNLAKLHQT